MFRVTGFALIALVAVLLAPAACFGQVPATGYGHPLGTTGGFRVPPGFGGLQNRLPAPQMIYTDPFGSARAAAALHAQYNPLSNINPPGTYGGIPANTYPTNLAQQPNYYTPPASSGTPGYAGTGNSSGGAFPGDESELGGLFGVTRFDNSAAGSGAGRMVVRRPAVSLQLGFTAPPALASDATARIQKTIVSTPALAAGSKIDAVMEGSTLVLRGTVPGDHEKQLARMIALLEPGVAEVRNELTVPPPKPSPEGPENVPPPPPEAGKREEQ
jgi:hypothetical protein